MAIALVRLKSAGKHLSKVYHSLMENKMFFLNSVNFNHNVFLKWLHGAHSLATGLWLTGSFRLWSASHLVTKHQDGENTHKKASHNSIYWWYLSSYVTLLYRLWLWRKNSVLTLFWVVVTNLLKQFFLDWTGVSTTYSYGPLICI